MMKKSILLASTTMLTLLWGVDGRASIANATLEELVLMSETIVLEEPIGGCRGAEKSEGDIHSRGRVAAVRVLESLKGAASPGDCLSICFGEDLDSPKPTEYAKAVLFLKKRSSPECLEVARYYRGLVEVTEGHAKTQFIEEEPQDQDLAAFLLKIREIVERRRAQNKMR